MKRIINFLYILWIIISFGFLGTAILRFYPIYDGNELPLFTDITLLFFIPSYFAMLWLIIHIINIFIQNEKLKFIICGLGYILAFIYSLTLMEFSLYLRIIISIVGSVAGLIYFIISNVLFKNSTLRGYVKTFI